ncbi:MAG: 3-dehydroquinate synthase [Acidobacteriota bacterium]
MTPFLMIRQASATYPVYVGRELLDQVGALVRPRGRVFVITSNELRTRFGNRVAHSFDRTNVVEFAGRTNRSSGQAEVITMPEGEAFKTLDTANGIVTALLDRGAKRDSMAVVVGGGMIGDTAGFAASIFLRGIDLIHVPTTLLAQVDSSLGGKLAVNHAKGKNLIGSFYPPLAVVSDTALLSTLPQRELLSGMYEALKGGVIGDPELFEMFEARDTNIDDMVRRAIRVKAEIVSADEKEADLRRLLNYGHTIAHGIETAMNYECITHGEAVAWGMIGANAIAVKRGLLPELVRERIDRTILALEPTRIPPSVDQQKVLATTEHDKKNTGSQRVMVLPRAIGRCDVVTDVTEEEIAFGIRSALAPRS